MCREKEGKKNRRGVYFAVVAGLFQVGVLDGGAAKTGVTLLRLESLIYCGAPLARPLFRYLS